MNQSEIDNIIIICVVPPKLKQAVISVLEGATAYNAAKDVLGDINAQVQVRRYVAKVRKCQLDVEQLSQR